MKIGVRGFQSIKKAVIEVEPGQIVGVVGLNNYGKSAIIRAIRAFICNASDKEVINIDIGSIRVAIRTDRGLFIWEKDSKSASYTKNDKKEMKLNKAALDEVFPDSGFIVEKEDGTFLVPSIVPENETIFPFSLTPSVAFRIFSRFMAPPKISAVIKDLKEKLKEDKSSVVGIRGAIDAYETEVSRNVTERGMLPTKEEVTLIREKAEKVQVVKVRMDRIDSDVVRLTKELGSVNDEMRAKDYDGIRALDLMVTGVKNRQVQDSVVLGLVDRAEVFEKRLVDIGVRKGALQEFLDSHKARIDKIANMKKTVADFASLDGEWRVVTASIGIQMDKWKVAKKGIEKFKACPLCRREF